MRHHNSVFHDLLKRVPWARFARQVDAHGADKHVQRLSTKDQLIALLYGQLAGASSLREIVGGLQSHCARLYHVGGRPVSRSTLSDANAKRSSAVFSDLFTSLVGMAQRGLRQKLDEATYLIDASPLALSGAGSQWAYFSSKASGAKLHLIYDADAACPIYACITAAKVSDIKVAQEMPIEAGATYVFDLGYYDYAWWARLDTEGCRIVTRFKSHTPLIEPIEQAAPQNSDILSDRVGLLPKRQRRSGKNPFSKPVREITVRIETGKVLRILSNDLEASAREIADLYKRRWAIELFFRWVKQNLKIRHFLGNSENAVRIQIAVALIAYLLIHLAKADQKAIKSSLAFARLLRSNLMHRKRIDRLLKPEPNRPESQNQMAFI